VLLAACVAVLVTGAWVLWGRGHGDSGYRVSLVPAEPLPMAACVRQFAKLGGTGSVECRAGDGKAWFSLRLRNVSDGQGFPVCHATAFDADGDPLFEDDIPLGWIRIPQGPPVRRGTSLSVTWYFAAAGEPVVDHYTAACHGRSSDDLPI
jgi:hypothetical protein